MGVQAGIVDSDAALPTLVSMFDVVPGPHSRMIALARCRARDALRCLIVDSSYWASLIEREVGVSALTIGTDVSSEDDWSVTAVELTLDEISAARAGLDLGLRIRPVRLPTVDDD